MDKIAKLYDSIDEGPPSPRIPRYNTNKLLKTAARYWHVAVIKWVLEAASCVRQISGLWQPRRAALGNSHIDDFSALLQYESMKYATVSGKTVS